MIIYTILPYNHWVERRIPSLTYSWKDYNGDKNLITESTPRIKLTWPFVMHSAIFDEGYSRNVTCLPNMISMFLFRTNSHQTIYIQGATVLCMSLDTINWILYYIFFYFTGITELIERQSWSCRFSDLPLFRKTIILESWGWWCQRPCAMQQPGWNGW